MVRDSAYLKNDTNLKGRDWSYHNYRDSKINNFKLSVDFLLEKGYFVFRMGKIVNKKLEIEHPNFMDYANSKSRSDFLDIWLTANCSFAITSTFGLSNVAMTFRRPCALIDAMPLGGIDAITNKNHVWLPKKLKRKKNKEFLSLKEQIQNGSIGFFRTYQYDNAGIQLIDNSPEDILATVNEIEQKVNGQWVEKKNDIELQNKYWSILKTWKNFKNFHGDTIEKLPDNFLRNNYKWFLK